MMDALAGLQDPIIQWFESHRNPPVALLSDSFLGWTHHLAHLLRIPRVVFHCYAAFTRAVFAHLWASSDGVEPGAELTFTELPRSPRLSWGQIPSLFRRVKDLECDNLVVSEFIKKSMVANELSWGSVFNSFDELEGEFLEHLREKLGPQKVYGVGPLNKVENLSVVVDGGGNVISWLDQFSSNDAVLYVCFGSQKFFTEAQMEALAIGLETSRARFAWAVGHGLVPDGFEGRVSGRGYVIKGWAPQTAILNHPAVGGFLSHCGWNSVMEAMASGVMILGWPMEADQFVNAKLLEEYKDAAVVVCEGAETVPNSAELARKITESMDGDAARRGRAKELSDKAMEAVKVGGSSIRDLDKLVQELSEFVGNGV